MYIHDYFHVSLSINMIAGFRDALLYRNFLNFLGYWAKYQYVTHGT